MAQLFVLAMGLGLGYLVASQVTRDFYLAQVEELEIALLHEHEKTKVLAQALVDCQNEKTPKKK